ncbi:MAG: BPSL0761 family protein [Paraburkholderia sp.]|uniref:BPSL0761 family protein n=1 Tax=Paraburkholderia sp. TaxID=1926495 RepID=UPI003C4389FD
MTTPYERTRAVLRARLLLAELVAATDDADWEHFRGRARTLLRHYPDSHHIRISAFALPDVWADPDAKWYE